MNTVDYNGANRESDRPIGSDGADILLPRVVQSGSLFLFANFSPIGTGAFLWRMGYAE